MFPRHLQSNDGKCTLRADGGWVNQFRGKIASKGLLLLLNSPMGNPLFYLSLKETRTSRYIQVYIRQLLQHNVIKVDQFRIASKYLVDRPTQLICIFTLQMIGPSSCYFPCFSHKRKYSLTFSKEGSI